MSSVCIGGLQPGRELTYQVAYVDGNGHVWELFWQGVAAVAARDLTAGSGAPVRATGTLAAYYRTITNSRHVIFRSPDGSLRQLTSEPGMPTNYLDLTSQYGLPPAADDPAASSSRARPSSTCPSGAPTGTSTRSSGDARRLTHNTTDASR